MDEPTNKAADSAASGEAMPETSPPSGGEPAPPDFPIPRTGEDGKPIYDQEFFLALAHCGKEVWNRRRAENPYVLQPFTRSWRRGENQPYVSVTFEGIDFREHAVIDFSGFDFGKDANFRTCKFESGIAKFTGATFANRADFSGATFGNRANFSGAIFGNRANFSGAIFGDWADFSGATFRGSVYFNAWSEDNGGIFRRVR